MTRDKFANILWGLLLIAAGVLIGGKVAGLIPFSLLFPGWWTLFIVIPCFISIVRNGFGIFNCGGILFGVLFFLQANGYIVSSTLGKMILPIVFLLIGLMILWNSLFRGLRHHYRGTKSYSATFAGNTICPTENEPFTGCMLDAVFGGLDVDLRGAEIEDNSVIEATALFGGMEIKVPNGVNVKLNRTSLFGGASSKVRNVSGQKVLYVNTLCMFGGVEIK